MAWIYKGAPPAVPTEMWSKYSDMRFGFDGQLLTNPEGTDSRGFASPPVPVALWLAFVMLVLTEGTRLAAVPMHAGLHHHGDAPQAAGYNLKEVFYC
jgi:hypothetical protein